ncbi:ABC transporter substrate-binding protein [Actinomyces faecalis]|uniref:ABC transporter substrate-binding protein n=1 Tax=Actinomyces faecalis TaxID=2722820 RepID=UPI001FCFDFC9|nr:ABC transporter substrate-binding protein [Actinomyces faecalis]
MFTKKAMIGLSALAVGALALTGCGSSSDGGSGKDADGKITLTVATFNEFGYDNLLEEYMELNPDIKVVEKKAATSNEARDNMNTRLAAGSGLSDIEAIEMDWLPELMQYADQFVDLSSDSVKDRWPEWKSGPATTEDGQLIGYGTDAGPEALCYRADLFAKANLPTDRNEVAKLLEGDWDSYFKVGKQFVDATGIPWYDGATGTYQGMLNQIQNPFESDDDSVMPLKDNTTIRDTYDTILDQSEAGLSAGLSQWSEDWVNSFQNDGFATMLCPPWMLGVVEGNAAGVEGWDVAPVFPGGGGNWGGSYLTVPTQGKHQAEAQALADWLTAPEQQIKAFQTKGNFPSQVDALDDPALLDYKNEFFNDAPIGQIYSDMSKKIEISPYKGTNFFAITTLVTDALTRVDVDGTDDADSSWDKALSEFGQLGLE